MLENYTRVRLTSDKYQASGASCFDVGYIIEVYPENKYEVEFSDQNGIKTAQIVAREEGLQLAPPSHSAPRRTVAVNPIAVNPIEEQITHEPSRSRR